MKLLYKYLLRFFPKTGLLLLFVALAFASCHDEPNPYDDYFNRLSNTTWRLDQIENHSGYPLPELNQFIGQTFSFSNVEYPYNNEKNYACYRGKHYILYSSYKNAVLTWNLNGAWDLNNSLLFPEECPNLTYEQRNLAYNYFPNGNIEYFDSNKLILYNDIMNYKYICSYVSNFTPPVNSGSEFSRPNNNNNNNDNDDDKEDNGNDSGHQPSYELPEIGLEDYTAYSTRITLKYRIYNQDEAKVTSAKGYYGTSSPSSSVNGNVAGSLITIHISGLKKNTTYYVKCTANGKGGSASSSTTKIITDP